MDTTQMILAKVAWAVALGAGTALLLALMAAAVLLALEELGLRRVANVLSIWSWLIDRSVVLRMQAPLWVRSVLTVARPSKLLKSLDPSDFVDPLRRRTQELWNKVGRPQDSPAQVPAQMPTPVAPYEDWHARTLVPFWKVIGGAVSLPARQLLGVLSASVQGDAANRRPSPFVCWIAAIGSLPIEPSPFAELPPIDKQPAKESPEADGGSEKESPRGDSIHTVIQRNADRALDSLQIRLARGWSVTRYAISLVIVGLMSTLLTAGTQDGGRPSASLDAERLWNGLVGFTPNLALWIVAAAFVPIVLGPLERLALRSR